MTLFNRDRHSAGLRGPLLPHSIPFYETRDQLFERLLSLAVADLAIRLGSEIKDIEVSFEVIPNERDLVLSDGSVPLGRHELGVAKKVVLYQKPIELRSSNVIEIDQLIRNTLAELVGLLLGLRPQDIDPKYQGK